MIFKPILKKMKTIELKTVSEKILVGNQLAETEIKYTELLKLAINSPVQGGYSVAEMAQRIRLLEIVENAESAKSDTVQFEDADFHALTRLVKDAKWSVVSKTIVEFAKEFEK